jgi:hypothetical protein
MTPTEVLVPAALAIVFVVAWFVGGLIDATRGDGTPSHTCPRTSDGRAQAQPQDRTQRRAMTHRGVASAPVIDQTATDAGRP